MIDYRPIITIVDAPFGVMERTSARAADGGGVEVWDSCVGLWRTDHALCAASIAAILRAAEARLVRLRLAGATGIEGTDQAARPKEDV